MNSQNGMVFDIQKFCIHDGPGIRTAIFLKGCPLKCKWCANPESQNRFPEYAFFKDKCIGDRNCIKACPKSCLKFDKVGLLRDYEECNYCGKCEEVCFAEAIIRYGKEMTVEEVVRECLLDREFYKKSGGGITVSGGEPFYQFNFLLNLLKAFKDYQIHTGIETSGYTSLKKLQEVMPYVDLFLYDLKGIDDEKHKINTGVSNTIILENLVYLSKINKNVIIRVPVIPQYNGENDDLLSLIEFIKGLPNSYEVNLLPYHRLGVSKYSALRRHYSLESLEVPTQERMLNIKQMFEQYGIKVQIGG